MAESQKKEITIRLAVAEDAAAIVDFVRDLHAEGIDTIHPPRRTVEEQANVISSWEGQRSFGIVALSGGRVIGHLVFICGGLPHNEHAGFFGIAIARAGRGQGVGTRLIKEMEDRVRAYTDLCRIELEVMARNEAAIRLYERLGYVMEGRKRKATNTTGTPEDLIIMAKVW